MKRIAETPLLLSEVDERLVVLPADDPQDLIHGVDLNAAPYRKRLPAIRDTQQKEAYEDGKDLVLQCRNNCIIISKHLFCI